MLNTCSQVISLAKELETKSAQFYRDLAAKFAGSGEIFLAFASENQKNIQAIERAYYGVITDAIEGCFAFNLDPAKYLIDCTFPAAFPEALKQASSMENVLIAFYTDAAEQSRSLMADVPRSFLLVARKRNGRFEKLAGLKG